MQGKTPEAAIRLLEDARALEEAGAFSIVLETIPEPLAALITRKISIPTIGIGAGIGCDGQVLVFHDILGLSDRLPKHAKQYAKLTDIIRNAVTEYHNEVKAGTFPTEKQSFSMDESILEELETEPLPSDEEPEPKPAPSEREVDTKKILEVAESKCQQEGAVDLLDFLESRLVRTSFDLFKVKKVLLANGYECHERRAINDWQDWCGYQKNRTHFHRQTDLQHLQSRR